MKLNNHTQAKYVCPNCGKGYDTSKLCEVCTGVGESGPEYPYVETVPVMSTLQDDIKRLREFRKASEADNCDCGCFQDESIANVCDALEQELKDGEEMQSTITNLNVAFDTLCEENRDFRSENDALSQSFYDCNKYAVELEAKLAARPDITHERLRQMRAKAVRRWKEIKDLEDQVDVQGAANARLEMKLERTEMRATALEDSLKAYEGQAARLEECRGALRSLYEENLSYITVNNLGDPHHNESMKKARKALGDKD